MANEFNQSGFGNIGFQSISGSNINVTQIIGVSPEYINLQTQLRDMEQLLALLPGDKEQERNELSARIYQHKQLIESFKSDVLKLAESFSRIEINTDRLRRAKEHFDKGEITEARVFLEDSLEEMADEKRALLAKKKEYEEGTLPQLQSKAYEYLILAQTTALNYENPNRIEDAKKYFEDSIECAVSFENLFAYAYFLGEHSFFAEAIEYYIQASEIAKNEGGLQNEEYCQGNLGIAYSSMGEYPKAVEYLKRAIEISKKIGYRHGEGTNLGTLGNVYFEQGKYLKAIDCFLQALEISRETGDRNCQSDQMGNIGMAFSALGQFPLAINYCNQGLEISSEIGDLGSVGAKLGNLGSTYYKMGDFAAALEYYKNALNIAFTIGHRQFEGRWLSGLGLVYHAQSEYDKAITFQERALKIAREIGDRLSEGGSLANLGGHYYALEIKEKACEYWKQAIAVFEAIGVLMLRWGDIRCEWRDAPKRIQRIQNNRIRILVFFWCNFVLFRGSGFKP